MPHRAPPPVPPHTMPKLSPMFWAVAACWVAYLCWVFASSLDLLP